MALLGEPRGPLSCYEDNNASLNQFTMEYVIADATAVEKKQEGTDFP